MTSIIQLILTSTVVSVVVGGIVNLRASRNLEKLKGQILVEVEHDKKTYDLELKPIHAQLDRIEFEHQTRFAKLHEERITVIAELYQRFTKVALLLSPWTAYYDYGPKDLEPEEWIKLATKEEYDFWVYYLQHKYWFDESLCEALDDLQPAIAKAIMAKHLLLDAHSKSADSEADKDHRADTFKETEDELKRINRIQEGIIDHLRKVLGVEDQDGKAIMPPIMRL